MTSFSTQTFTPSEREGIYRRNFVFFLLDGILFSVAMALIGTNTVIPDFVRRLTDSEILIGLSGTLFEIGFTLPQLFIARYIIRHDRKKWWFVGPNIPVRFVMLLFAGMIVALGAGQPGAILAGFLVCYGITALGDGLVGVPWADLTGTSLDGRWRARMLGLTSAIAGLTILAISPLIRQILGDAGPGFPNNYALLFGASGMFFALSILPVLFVHELPGGKAVEKIPSLSEFLPELGRILREDAPFRAMVITRLFTTLFAMASPFYIGFATEQLKLSSDVAVPNLLTMQTLGGVFGALLYTRFGARSNLSYIRFALCGGALLPISALLAVNVGPLPLYFGFFMSGIALSNLGFSYFNWVVTHADPDQRPIYAGLFNTIGAVMSLMAPFIGGTIVQRLGYEALFVVAIVMVSSALFVTVRYVPAPKIKVDAAGD
jgi:MFS family permease